MLQTKGDKVDAKSGHRCGERSAEAKKKIEDSIAPFGDYSDDSPGYPSRSHLLRHSPQGFFMKGMSTTRQVMSTVDVHRFYTLLCPFCMYRRKRSVFRRANLKCLDSHHQMPTTALNPSYIIQRGRRSVITSVIKVPRKVAQQSQPSIVLLILFSSINTQVELR